MSDHHSEEIKGRSETLNDRLVRAQEVLADAFGYASFRPGQQQVVRTLLDGRDALTVMPTGAGKSICYQIPAVVLPGITIVISPLVSLMADQVRALQEVGLRSAFINSTLSAAEQTEVITCAQYGLFDLIYVAPERLSDPRFKEFASSASLSLIAVDEAHCISQWGQDFRPSYLAISDFIDTLPTRPIVAALTATATERVRKDIIRLLGLREPVITVTGFDRPNLHYTVERQEAKRKLARLDQFLAERPNESGIIYCSKRATVEEVCDYLQEQGVAATRYHAGLSASERERNQRSFVNDETPIIVATNAFGMGIDKSNVNYVVHFNMPGSVEAYYQEAGRAGRDGQPAECLLLWCDGDISTNRFFIEQSSDNEKLSPEETETVRQGRRRMLESMVGYCYTTGCLRRYLLRYFGELEDAAHVNEDSSEFSVADEANVLPCCSNCEGAFEAVDVTEEARAIMRCVQALRGRYGKTTVVDVLRGAETENLRQWGLMNLPVYGSSTAKAPLLKEVVELLAAGDYLAITEGKFPLVGFGSRYREAAAPDFSLTIKRTPSLSRTTAQKKHVVKQTEATTLTDSDQAVFERLRALRLRLAQEAGVPPYVIFHDSTLAAMAAKRPETKAEFLALPGVGEKKLATYGDAFLEELAKNVSL